MLCIKPTSQQSMVVWPPEVAETAISHSCFRSIHLVVTLYASIKLPSASVAYNKEPSRIMKADMPRHAALIH